MYLLAFFYRYVSKDIFDLKTGEIVLSKTKGHVVLKGRVITCNYSEMGLQMAGGWLLFRQLILGGNTAQFIRIIRGLTYSSYLTKCSTIECI